MNSPAGLLCSPHPLLFRFPFYGNLFLRHSIRYFREESAHSQAGTHPRQDVRFSPLSAIGLAMTSRRKTTVGNIQDLRLMFNADELGVIV